ncbi:MAG: MOSC domain-containing protein [Pseudomonadota bacterium]
MAETIETATSTGVRPKSMAELEAQLPDILAAPKDNGTVDMIVVRPAHGDRLTPQSHPLSLAHGLKGDHWNQGCHVMLPDGRPSPEVQICIMPSRVIRAVAGGPENWAPAGDNLFIDMDLTPHNTPPGTRIALGTVEMIITAEPHKGCQKFVDRYGRDACKFVNIGKGGQLKLRGIYSRVTRDGVVSVGDRVTKIT